MRFTIRHAALLLVSLCLSLTPLSAIPIRYLEFPTATPNGSTLSLPLELNLPCQGAVRVAVSPVSPTATAPSFTYFEQVAARNQSATLGSTTYSWGTDTNRFNVISNSGNLDYDVTFTFATPPDPTRLLLVVVGLAVGSTATISTQPATPIGSLVGEFRFPSPSSSTTFATGAVLGNQPGTGDPVNTGWALYRSTGTFTSLTVRMHQLGGDGVGWTLANVCESSLTVQKVVQGAPAGFSGTFSFLVECATPQGFTHTTVTAAWPGAASVVVPGVPPGSTCTVVESSNFPTLPGGFVWAGTTLSPTNGTVVTTAAGVTVTATNTVRPCRDTCSVHIRKRVEGLPAGFTGTFSGVLRCWINNVPTDFPVTLTYPGTPVATVANLPQGVSCTFLETGFPALPVPYQWMPPVYSTPFGQIDLVGACEHEIVVTNRAKLCCGDRDPSGINPR